MPNTNPEVHTEFGPPDPGAAPLNLVQLWEWLNRTVSSQIIGSYLPYVIQNGDPDVDDQDKVWIELDTQGRPLATKIYWSGSGSWRRIYNGMLGEIRAFHGAPGYTSDSGSNFNADGMGNPGGEYDGWHLCNGKDGTPDMSDKFVVGAHMNKTDSKSDYDDGEWITYVTGEAGHTGGEKDFTLTDKSTFQPMIDIAQIKVGKYLSGGGGDHLDVDGLMWGTISLMDENKNMTLNAQSEGNSTPDPVSVINPFIALGWIIFVGYQA